jgi:integral membrane protein (TIGR00529 family)
LSLISPPIALVISFSVLIVLLYKRVNLGITLNATAFLLGFLALDWWQIPELVYKTSTEPLTISIVVATFLIMWLSQLYKETGLIKQLSESLSKIVKNPKIIISVLPAVIGFLPVAGGALMSAPLVDSEAEKLDMKPEKKAYTNLWFRHTIFPVYPLSQVLILTAALTNTTVSSIIIRQIPAVIVMVIVGYIIGFRKVARIGRDENPKEDSMMGSNIKNFITSFSPILVAIVVAVGLDLTGFELSRLGFGVLIATVVGMIVIVAVSKMSRKVFFNPLKDWGIYGVTLAAYGAFLLGNFMKATGISAIFESLASNGSIDITILLILVPAILGVLTASAFGGVSISVPILGGIVPLLTTRMASLIYMSAYLGYVISPTHLCFAFTADYFKCTLTKIYKYLAPSFAITFATVLLIYFFA